MHTVTAETVWPWEDPVYKHVFGHRFTGAATRARTAMHAGESQRRAETAELLHALANEIADGEHGALLDDVNALTRRAATGVRPVEQPAAAEKARAMLVLATVFDELPEARTLRQRVRGRRAA